MSLIYLDNAATTRALPEVANVMLDALQVSFYNPSAPYGASAAVESAVEQVRRKILLTALKALSTPVTGQTIFEVK